MKTLNLDELEQHANTVTRAGVSYRIRPVTGRVLSMVAAAEQAVGLEKLRAYYDIAALLVPTMRREDVEDLSPDQIAAIMTLARAEVDAVDESAAYPNGASPAPATATPGQSPATSSAASS